MINSQQQHTIKQIWTDIQQAEQNGDLAQVEYLYQQLLKITPAQIQVIEQITKLALRIRKYDFALQVIRNALEKDPGFIPGFFFMAIIASQRGDSDSAIHYYRQCLAMGGQELAIYQNLANVLREKELWEEAAAVYRELATRAPNQADVYIKWGYVLYKQGKLADASVVYNRVLKIQPASKEALKNLLIIHCERCEKTVVMALYQRGLAIDSGNAEWCYGLGVILHEHNMPLEAIVAFKQAIKIRPMWDEAHWVLGVSLLKVGSFRTGFCEYEWRKKRQRVKGYHDYFLRKPEWQGEIFSGKKLLVYAEQGLGDLLQFVRYLPMVKARGGSVALLGRTPLDRLFASAVGVDELVENEQSIEDFDLAIALLSLPTIFGTTLNTIPATIPYLQVEEDIIAKWQPCMDDRSFKIGLVWAGKTTSDALGGRSMTFSQFEPLVTVPGVTFYSLQKGEGEEQAEFPPTGMQFRHISDKIHDFADTAGAIANLDLVISIDTSVVHLAGAMGKEVWVLLPYNAEWRWLLDKEESPWYPTMRLFRQKKQGNWSGVMDDVVKELQKLVANN